MDFSIKQIMSDNSYNEACKTFLSLTKDEETLEKLKEILYYGKTANYHLKSNIHCRDNPEIERSRRIALASVFLRNPETFAFLEKNNINIFHGTNANALPGILKYGMNSHKSLIKENAPVLTGEKWSRAHTSRDFISFTDVLDIAENYSTLSSPNGDENLSFSVIIGVKEEEMNKAKIVPVDSDLSEIGVSQHFPLESIGCICVPEDKVDFVKKMMSDEQIPVLGMSDLSQKGYYIFEGEDTEVYPEVYKSKPETTKSFSTDEIKEVATSRSLFKMKNFIEKIKTVFKKEGEDKDGRHFK